MKITSYIILIFSINFSAFAEFNSSTLIGNWGCFQQVKISETITAKNHNSVSYPFSQARAVQSGVITIFDNNQTYSIVNYKLEFTFTLEGSEIVSQLELLEQSIEKDDLNLFNTELFQLFPKIGSTVKGNITIYSDNSMRTVYSDGNFVDCERK